MIKKTFELYSLFSSWFVCVRVSQLLIKDITWLILMRRDMHGPM